MHYSMSVNGKVEEGTMEIDTGNNVERFSSGRGPDEALEVHDFEIVSSGGSNRRQIRRRKKKERKFVPGHSREADQRAHIRNDSPFRPAGVATRRLCGFH